MPIALHLRHPAHLCLRMRRAPRRLAMVAAALILLSTGSVAPAQTAAPSLSLTATARLLAGVDPQGGKAVSDPALEQILSDEAWRAHASAARSGDRQLQSRLSAMRSWSKAHLPAADATVVYPFSGPDFVNAYALLPRADHYVFFSLEPVGTVPDLDGMPPEARARLFSSLRQALNDLIALNFFITPNMKAEIDQSELGTLPVLLAQMGLMDLHIDAVRAGLPWETAAAPSDHHGAKGLHIEFSNPATSRHQTLDYVAMDVSDSALAHKPEFLTWLDGLGHGTILLKSASYLLHGTHFRKLEGSLIRFGDTVVQDDTGFPFHTLRDAGYDISLFGQYEKPVKLFESRYQPDLAEAFDTAGPTGRVPFPFGYNWRKEGKSGVIVAHRASTAR